MVPNMSDDISSEADFTSHQWPLEISEYLKVDGDHYWPDSDPNQCFTSDGHVPNQLIYQNSIEVGDDFGGNGGRVEGSSSSCGPRDIINSGYQKKKEGRERFAFRTRSEVEVLDDGYKWRKYGKKMVKNSPNPRNYYRCSEEGCPVKKRVERDGNDPEYVITTYEGVHTHSSFY